MSRRPRRMSSAVVSAVRLAFMVDSPKKCFVAHEKINPAGRPWAARVSCDLTGRAGGRRNKLGDGKGRLDDAKIDD